MKYLVLRNCYVNDRYYAEGLICDLPDDMEKSPKNFQLVESKDTPKDSWEILADSPMWVNPTPEPIEPTPAPSSETTGDSIEDRPLYISDKDQKKLERKDVTIDVSKPMEVIIKSGGK